MQVARSQILVFIALAVGLMVCGEAQAAITRPLTHYSANPHYFTDGAAPVVLLGAGNLLPLDTGGRTFADSSVFVDYRPYIDQLAAHKVNYVRVWLLRPWNSPREEWPWKRVSGYGTANDGGDKFDLSQWNTTAWSRIRDACAYALSKGIYLEIHLWEECGLEADGAASDGSHRWSWHPWNPSNNVNGLSLPSGSSSSVDAVPEFYSLSNSKLKSLQELYVAKLIAETSGYPNVIYEICNEYTGPTDWELHWVGFIADRCSNPISVNRLQSAPSYYWTDSRIKMVNFHWKTTSPGTINSNMLSYYSQNKPINYGEPPEKSTVGLREYRHMLWASFVGSGHIELHTGYNHEDGWDMAYMIRKFIEENGVRFWEMTPKNALVTSTPGGSAYCLAKEGSEYVIQIVGSGGGSMTVNLQPGKTYQARVYRSDGTYVNLSVSGNTISGIPSYSYDTVVYIKALGDPVTTTPNVSLSLAVDRTQTDPGDTLTYTLTYRNTGDGDASTVSVTCPAPEHTTYVTGSASSGGIYNSAERAVRWSIPTIAPGGSGTLTFKVKVD